MTLAERGVQIWQVLVGAAHRRETITYEQLTTLIGMNAPGGMSQPLDRVLNYCDREGLPKLTIIVVNKKSGRPGVGSGFEEADHDTEREKVYRHPWFERLPPTVGDLQE